MNDKTKIPVVPLLFSIAAIFILASVAGVFSFIQEKIDNHQLSRFADKIAATDHIVASRWAHYPSRRLVSLSLTGEDAKRVVQAVSSGRADRRVYSNMWLVTVRFFGGTNVLGEILTDGTLFLADGRQYKDASGVLDELVATPLSKMVHETEMKGTESP